MHNRRHDDWWAIGDGAGSVLFFIGCMALSVVFVLSAPTEREKERPELTSCVDGIVMQWGGSDWQPVYLKGKRVTIPCSPVGELRGPK